MNIEDIKQLISLVNDSDIRNFELTLDNGTVKMSKNDSVSFAPAAAPVPEAAPVSAPAVSAEAPKAEAVAEAPKAEAKGGEIVKAPIVGTFYKSAGPDKPSFVEVGSRVKKGDVLCIIEAMKIMNEVVSGFDGEVAEIMAENEQLVEYGQPLFRIV
jgi:acetyl-CoA carboxylase biotin carboxyl carrier protein